jgi:hypothetical protein
MSEQTPADDEVRAQVERVLGERVATLDRLSEDGRRNYVARVCAERRCLPAVAGLAQSVAEWARARLPDLEQLPLYRPFR